MKTFKIVAAIAAATISAFTIAPAFAQGDATSPGQGHYEWQQAPQHGPRAPLRDPTRVWVPDASQVASCDCGMMKMGTTDATNCMKTMHGAMAGSGASAS